MCHDDPVVAEVERCLYEVGPVVGEQALLRFEAQCLGRVAVHARVGLGAAEHGRNRIRVEVATKPDTVVERGKFGEASETTPSCRPLVRSSSKTLSTSGYGSTTVVGSSGWLSSARRASFGLLRRPPGRGHVPAEDRGLGVGSGSGGAHIRLLTTVDS